MTAMTSSATSSPLPLAGDATWPSTIPTSHASALNAIEQEQRQDEDGAAESKDERRAAADARQPPR